MKTFLAVTLFIRILTFAFAIGGDADDDGDNYSKCDDVTPMNNFDSDKYFKKLKHIYVTHARYGGRLAVCREFRTDKSPNGIISYNYEFNGNGKPEHGIKSYTAKCTGTEDSKQKGQFSFKCTQKYDWDIEYFKQEFYTPCHTDEENDVVEDELKEKVKEVAVQEIIGTAEGDDKEYTHGFSLKVTVLFTDYKKYAIIHRCVEISLEEKTIFVDNYVVFNVKEKAKLPEEAKQKFKKYKWQEGKFANRKICNRNKKIKK